MFAWTLAGTLAGTGVMSLCLFLAYRLVKALADPHPDVDGLTPERCSAIALGAVLAWVRQGGRAALTAHLRTCDERAPTDLLGGETCLHLVTAARSAAGLDTASLRQNPLLADPAAVPALLQAQADPGHVRGMCQVDLPAEQGMEQRARAVAQVEGGIRAWARHYLARLLPALAPEHADLLSPEQRAALRHMLDEDGAAEELRLAALAGLAAVGGPEDLAAVRRIARRIARDATDVRVGQAASECAARLAARLAELRVRTTLVRAAGAPDEDHLVRPAAGRHDDGTDMVRPAQP